MPTERGTAGWHMYQGVVHTSLRLRSRIYNNSLGERLLFPAWNFPRSKQAPSQQRRLWVWKRGHLVPWKRVKSMYQFPAEVMPLQKSLGGGLNWCPSIHYREILDFTPAGIRVAFSYRRTQWGVVHYRCYGDSCCWETSEKINFDHLLKRWCSIKEIEVYLLCEILTSKDTLQGQKNCCEPPLEKIFLHRAKENN